MSSPTRSDLAARMADVARSFSPPRSLDQLLKRVTTTAVDVIDGADVAGVLLTKKGGGHESLVGTAELVVKLDDIQAKFGSGPCIDAATDELLIRVDDFATERRWPEFAPAAVELGVRSSLSAQLYGSGPSAGALNVFGHRPNVFTSDSEAIGLVLAAHAAAAILASRHSEQLKSAIASRDMIGQAKGIIMERFDVDAVRAFEMLRQLSQTENTPLVDIARRVIETRG